ncbi:MAG: hypothetical protein M0R77_19885 [Gammaproteobacteria bacterium]|nr:hypothetical protein [Gammaproteobacteria bacterium]
MSDNSFQATTVIPYVVSTHSEEWAHMMNDLSGRLHDLRRQHSDMMFESMTELPKAEREAAAWAQLEWFNVELRKIVSTWTNHDRINFYVYNEKLREALDPIMEPWEIDFALFCK